MKKGEYVMLVGMAGILAVVIAGERLAPALGVVLFFVFVLAIPIGLGMSISVEAKTRS